MFIKHNIDGMFSYNEKTQVLLLLLASLSSQIVIPGNTQKSCIQHTYIGRHGLETENARKREVMRADQGHSFHPAR